MFATIKDSPQSNQNIVPKMARICSTPVTFLAFTSSKEWQKGIRKDEGPACLKSHHLV